MNIALNDTGALQGFTVTSGSAVLAELRHNDAHTGFHYYNLATGELYPNLSLEDALIVSAAAATNPAQDVATYSLNQHPGDCTDMLVLLTDLQLKHGFHTPLLEVMARHGVSPEVIETVRHGKSFDRHTFDRLDTLVQNGQAGYSLASGVEIVTHNGVPLTIVYCDGHTLTEADWTPKTGEYRILVNGKPTPERKNRQQVLLDAQAFARKFGNLWIDDRHYTEPAFIEALGAMQFSAREKAYLESVTQLLEAKGLVSETDNEKLEKLKQALATNCFNSFTAKGGDDISKDELGDLSAQSQISKHILKAAFRQL